MNKLTPPSYDDSAALDILASNSLLSSFPRLKRHLSKLKAGYNQYLDVNGDVTAVDRIVIPKVTARFLRGHYASPPEAIEYITSMRIDSAPDTCPMCGSFRCTTLDHLMDKGTHPAFSIFTPNLVPACDCNIKRLKPLVGPNAGERILHPYFDAVLAERIVAARFTDLGPVPHVETRIVLSATHPQRAAAAFHHDSVIMRTTVHSWIGRQWANLMRQPSLAVHDLARNPVDRLELATMIRSERDRSDDAKRSKNNWESVFLTGLLDDDVLDWLYERLSRAGRQPDGDLL